MKQFEKVTVPTKAGYRPPNQNLQGISDCLLQRGSAHGFARLKFFFKNVGIKTCRQ